MHPPFDDLRSFLTSLQAEKQLLRIERSVNPEPDLGAAGRAVANLGTTAPALLFTNIAGFTEAQVALNVHGSWANHALMLGMPKSSTVKEQFFELDERWQKYPVAVDRRADWAAAIRWRGPDRTGEPAAPSPRDRSARSRRPG